MPYDLDGWGRRDAGHADGVGERQATDQEGPLIELGGEEQPEGRGCFATARQQPRDQELGGFAG